MLGEPPTLDPYAENSSDLSYFLARPVYRSLFRLAPDGSVTSDLLDVEDPDSLRPKGDGFVVTFEPARWSDGSEITTGDIIRSVRRAEYPSGFVGVRDLRAVGRRRVFMEGGAFSDLERRLAVGTFIVPPERDLTLGAGPFVVDRYVPGLEVSYVRNPEWDGDGPVADRITVRFIASLEIMLQLLERERLDAAAVPSAVNIDQRLAERGLSYASTPGRETIILDLREAAGRRLRAAVATSVDLQVIAEGLIRDEGRRLRVAGVSKDVEAPPGTEIQLGTASGDELLTMIQRVMQRQLEDKGIASELVTIDPATLYGSWESASPLDVALRREMVPGFHERKIPRDRSWFPMFSVESFLAWNEGVVGLEPNGSLDGPFWNAELWGLD